MPWTTTTLSDIEDSNIIDEFSDSTTTIEDNNDNDCDNIAYTIPSRHAGNFSNAIEEDAPKG